MNRLLALAAALILSALTVSSAVATPSGPMSFRLSRDAGGRIQLNLYRGDRGHDHLSSTFSPADLPGLDVAVLSEPGQRPIRFAMVRDAGRVDCAGTGGSAMASGGCRFTPDAAFASMLASRGIGRATDEQAYEMTMVGVRRDLIDALVASRFPRPDIDKLVELSAVGVTPRFIADLSARGYAPSSLDDLTEFAALDVSPAYIDALASAGYRNIGAGKIAELKAVGVNPAMIATLAAAGYRNLSVDDLEQMAALNITPGFIQGFARIGYTNLPVDQLVELKALDVTPEFVLNANRNGFGPISPKKAAELKAIGDER
jgi:hypothetical protein